MFIIFYILLKRKLNHSKGIGLYDGNSSKITGIVSQNKGIIISEILCYVITFFGVLGLFEIGMKKSNIEICMYLFHYVYG